MPEKDFGPVCKWQCFCWFCAEMKQQQYSDHHRRLNNTASLCALISFLHWDIRTGRMWVRDVIHRRQIYGEYYRRGQKKHRVKVPSPAPFWKVERFVGKWLIDSDFNQNRTVWMKHDSVFSDESYRGRAGSSSCWRSRRCRRCRTAGWGRLRYPAAADPAAGEGTPPSGRGFPAGCSSDWRKRWRGRSLIGRGQSCYHWRLLGNREEVKSLIMCSSKSVCSTWSSCWQ